MIKKFFFTILITLILFSNSCGPSHDDGIVVTVGPSYYKPFTIILENQTSSILMPYLTTSPYGYGQPIITLVPGGSVIISLGFIPSYIQIWAVDNLGVVYPTRTIYYNIDYFSYSDSVTYLYY